MRKQIMKKIPKKYDVCLNLTLKIAKKIYKDNLNSILLAGSVGKGNCIDGWSDLDLYIITNELNLNQNKKFYEETKKIDIHVGTTFYTKQMIEELNIDNKTFITFYEYHNYNVNTLIYGKIRIPKISYEKIKSIEDNLGNSIQTVERELYNYEMKKDNFEALIKKLTVLMKIYLNKNFNIFTYGYEMVFREYKKNVNKSLDIDIKKIIISKDKDDIIEETVRTILLDVIIERRNVK